MKRSILGFFVMSALVTSVSAQTTYDSSTLVDTNNTSTSTSTVTTNNNNTSTSTATSTSTVNSTSTNTNNNNNTSVSTNNNVNSGTQTFNNNNVNTGNMTNNNINTSTATSTNNNNNVNSTTSNNVNQNIQSGEMTNRNINDSNITQKVIQPPPTAISPAMMSGGNNDLCTTGTSGAVQTQIMGISSGGTVRDMNCERLKNAKTLFDMGMKVAAVATLCQDRRVFDAMWNAGTPCPFEGEIGAKAKQLWETFPEKIPKKDEVKSDDFYKKTGWGALLGAILFKLF